LVLGFLLRLDGTDSLKNRNVQWGLAVLVQHEEVVWKVSQLGLEVVPVGLFEDQLVNRRVSMYVYPIIVGVYQVAPYMVKRFLLNLCELYVIGPRPHLRVVRIVDEPPNNINGH
jgi:hypothetical protein